MSSNKHILAVMGLALALSFKPVSFIGQHAGLEQSNTSVVFILPSSSSRVLHTHQHS